MSADGKIDYLDEIPGATGFPHKGLPTGWFQVDWSDALEPGQVKPVKYFGRELVLYRGETGAVVLMSAFCPHMGAHLGHGGKVVDGCNIKCPYHGWEWGANGRNVLVPSEGRPTTARRGLRVYRTFESNGIIWMWHDALGREPLWEPPAERRNEGNFLPVYPHCTYRWDNVRIRPQYITENSADLDHLIFVHKNGILPLIRTENDIPQMEEDGHIFRFIRKPPMQQTTCYGLGLSLIDFPFDPQRPHRAASLLYHATTPIDHEHSNMFGTLLLEQDRTVEGGDGPIPVGRAYKRVEEQLKQAGRDVPIWENMVYMERPAYTRLEGPMLIKIRRFAQRFYPESEPTAALKVGS
jgi:3-ketosteroid 9alpha-monooxygenase subunit A